MSGPQDIRGWQRLSPRITTSGRIEGKDVALLAALGIAHVINLAMADHPEALADEAALLAAAGLRYTHIPVPFDAPREEHYRSFAAALAGDEAPVHVHCIMNWRVSAFFYRYHREQGMKEREARALMEQHWQPETNPHPAAPQWSEFIRRWNEREV